MASFAVRCCITKYMWDGFFGAAKPTSRGGSENSSYGPVSLGQDSASGDVSLGFREGQVTDFGSWLEVGSLETWCRRIEIPS